MNTAGGSLPVSVVIVHWQQQQWLPACLDALFASEGVACEVTLVNNQPETDLEAILRRFPGVQVVQNPANLGYSAGNNEGIRRSRHEFILFLNADAFVRPDCVVRLAEALRADERIGFAHGKLLVHGSAGRLDGAGIAVSRGRRFWDRGRGEVDGGQFEQECFSVAGCGALLMFRRAALEDVRLEGEYFDEDFSAYKEDIDLCWRAWWRGWSGWYVPSAVALHVRGHGLPRLDDRNAGGLRRRVGVLQAFRGDRDFVRVRVMSARNQCWLEVKNEPASWMLMDLPWRVAAWIVWMSYAIFFERYMLRGLTEALCGWPGVWRKRRLIKAGRRVSPRDLRPLFRRGGLSPR
jgi:GT2 family glycosyltransferase